MYHTVWFDFRFQVRQLTKDKGDLTRRLDRFEVQHESQRLEGCQLKRDLKEASKENSQLQLQLSAARVQVSEEAEELL